MYALMARGKRGGVLSYRAFLYWRIAQAAVWLIGAAILFCLLFFPAVGILLFWNILIPVAPALFVVAAGLWRNICPLATTNLLPMHLALSKRKKLTAMQQGKLNLTAVVALYTIVPLRHAVFNNSGVATGLMIICMAVTGIVLGFFYEWKSAWCSGLCPIHPVEKLYGESVAVSVANTHCSSCMNCVVPCPDATPNIHPKSSTKTIYHKIGGLLIVGGLPGFIWGWFHVPDEAAISSVGLFFSVYRLPVLGMAVTLIVYALLDMIMQPTFERRLISIFAAMGISCYYWYRIPALFGFGHFGKDGLLVNLSGIITWWSIQSVTIAAVLFFFYWLLFRKKNKKSWLIRPAYASKEELLKQKNTV